MYDCTVPTIYRNNMLIGHINFIWFEGKMIP